LSMGKVRLLISDTPAAEADIRCYVTAHPEDSNGHIWMAECLYESRDYTGLSTFLRTVPRGRVQGWERFESIEKMWS
ncbi:MAG: hypothetical protein V1913_08800, partial [Fibrobacterota bacterium]